ncbi:uncharacterized protein B0H64DRAFT_317249 [Chaetomium fimeti]|uniref:C2H2-type domain-containing protein n=1 Tax=Chaetomium fimeti TaxID=1854472 RepID=A0AAE0HMN0_9PEZI|nr:hypothetical protein B0H64DRAFT_317249 [Chaetomium fimeti]
MTVTCKECKIEVASRAALAEHWREKREGGKKHYHCRQKPFQANLLEFHAAKQDLGCPGCHERFLSASGLIEHIEKNRCTRVRNDDYAARREEKLAFTRELERREYEDPDLPGPRPGLPGSSATGNGALDFTQYLSVATNIGVKAHPAGKQLASAWAAKKNLFPDAPAPVRPPPGEDVQPVVAKESRWSEHDPRNPGWNARKYFVTYLNKYKCPHDRCPKSFPSVAGLRGHLLSGPHTGLHKVQCPRCFKWFNTMAAITAHAESQSVRCDLHRTDGYRQLLDQMTAGMIDTAGKHEDGTLKYTVPDAARQYFGTSQGKWAAEVRKQQRGWGSTDEAEGDGGEQAPKQD